MGGFAAHYKGDVSEITMGHETGIYLQHNEPLHGLLLLQQLMTLQPSLLLGRALVQV